MERLSVFTPPRMEGDQVARRLIRAVRKESAAYEQAFNVATRTRTAHGIAHANSAREQLEQNLTLLESITGVRTALNERWRETCVTGRELLVNTHLLDPADAIEGDEDNAAPGSFSFRRDDSVQLDESSDEEDVAADIQIGTTQAGPVTMAMGSGSPVGQPAGTIPSSGGARVTFNSTVSVAPALAHAVSSTPEPAFDAATMPPVDVSSAYVSTSGVPSAFVSFAPTTTRSDVSAAAGEYSRACNVSVCGTQNTVFGSSLGAGPSRQVCSQVSPIGLASASGCVGRGPVSVGWATSSTYRASEDSGFPVSFHQGRVHPSGPSGTRVSPTPSESSIASRHDQEVDEVDARRRHRQEVSELQTRRDQLIMNQQKMMREAEECEMLIEEARRLESVRQEEATVVSGGVAGVLGTAGHGGGASVHGAPPSNVCGRVLPSQVVSSVGECGRSVSGCEVPPGSVCGRVLPAPVVSNTGTSGVSASMWGAPLNHVGGRVLSSQAVPVASGHDVVVPYSSVGSWVDGQSGGGVVWGGMAPPTSDVHGNYMSHMSQQTALQSVSAPDNAVARMSASTAPTSSRLLAMAHGVDVSPHVTFPPSQSPSTFSAPPSYHAVHPNGSFPSSHSAAVATPEVSVPVMVGAGGGGGPPPPQDDLNRLCGINAKSNARQMLVARRPAADKRFSGDKPNEDYEAFIRRFERNVKLDGVDHEMILLEVTHYVTGTAEVIAASYDDVVDAADALRQIKKHWRREFGRRIHSARQLLDTHLKGGPIKPENASEIRKFICNIEAVYRQSRGTGRAASFDNNDLITDILNARLPSFTKKWAQKLQGNLERQSAEDGEDVPDLTFQDFIKYLTEANGARLHELAIQKKPLTSSNFSASGGSTAAPSSKWRWAKVAAVDPEVAEVELTSTSTPEVAPLEDADADVDPDPEDVGAVDDPIDMTIAASMTSRPRSKVKTASTANRMLQPGYLAAAQNAQNAGVPTCLCCKAYGPLFHDLVNCREFAKLSVAERNQLVREWRICRICLQPGHWSTQCTCAERCGKMLSSQECAKDHHTLLHLDPVPVGPSGPLSKK